MKPARPADLTSVDWLGLNNEHPSLMLDVHRRREAGQVAGCFCREVIRVDVRLRRSTRGESYSGTVLTIDCGSNADGFFLQGWQREPMAPGLFQLRLHEALDAAETLLRLGR